MYTLLYFIRTGVGRILRAAAILLYFAYAVICSFIYFTTKSLDKQTRWSIAQVSLDWAP